MSLVKLCVWSVVQLASLVIYQEEGLRRRLGEEGKGVEEGGWIKVGIGEEGEGEEEKAIIQTEVDSEEEEVEDESEGGKMNAMTTKTKAAGLSLFVALLCRVLVYFPYSVHLSLPSFLFLPSARCSSHKSPALSLSLTHTPAKPFARRRASWEGRRGGRNCVNSIHLTRSRLRSPSWNGLGI